MVQKLLARSGEVRLVVATNQSVERIAPLKGEALQLFEEMTIDQRLCHTPEWGQFRLDKPVKMLNSTLSLF